MRNNRMKKWVGMLLSACLVVGLFPVTALAAEYNIWVNGIQVTSSNAGDVLSDGGTVKYDTQNSRLTLKGANLTNSGGQQAVIWSTVSLNLYLEGSSSITVPSDNTCLFGISTNNGDFNVNGTGILTVNSVDADKSGISAGSGTATVEAGATLNVTAKSFSAFQAGSLNISGNVEATSQSGNAIATSTGDLTISGSAQVKAYSMEGDALGGRNISISGNAVVTAQVAVAGTGINAQNNLTITGSANVTAKGVNSPGLLVGSALDISSDDIIDVDSNAVAIEAASVAISGGKVDVHSDTSNAIFATAGDINISGGSIDVYTGSDSQPGIYTPGAFSINGGATLDVTANNGGIQSENTFAVGISSIKISTPNGFAIIPLGWTMTFDQSVVCAYAAVGSTAADTTAYDGQLPNSGFAAAVYLYPYVELISLGAHDWGNWEFVDATNHKRTCKNNPLHVETEGHNGDPCSACSYNNTAYVAFDGNGGIGDMMQQSVSVGDTLALTANEFTREGYTFDGWNTQADGSGTAYADGASITPTGSMTLYAQWEPIEYTITYHLDGGTNATANPAKYTIETDTITLANPSKSGSIFGGWFDNEGLTGTAVTEITKGSTGNKELWAKWGTECTVTFDVNGGEWKDTTPATFTVAQGEVISKPTDPTRAADANASYRFDGWYTDNNTFANAYDFSIPVSGNLTLYAKWVEQHTATITIIGQNGQTYSNVSAKLMPLGSTIPVNEQDNLQGNNENPVKYAYSVTVDAGQYNLVITATEDSSGKTLTVTTLENLKSANVTQDIYLPESNKSSVVADNSGLGIIAGGVNTVASGQTPTDPNGYLEVKLPIASGYDTVTGAEDKQKIDTKAQTDGKTVLQELDIDLLLYQYDTGNAQIGDATNLGNNNATLLEILIPIDTTGKTADGFAVYRVHNGVLHTLPYNGESFSVDIDEGFIRLNVKLFSSYAIAYGTSSSGGTDPDPGTGGGSGSGTGGSAPVIIDPANDWGVIAYVGETAALDITALRADSYQWYVDRGDGRGFVPIPGATGPRYITSAVTKDNDGYVYRCVAMNAYGQATSPNITLNVMEYVEIPKTGDNSHVGLWVGLAMMGLAGMMFSALMLRRRKS